MKIILSILLCLVGIPAFGQKISDLPEVLALTNGHLFIVAKPGVANYKVTYGTLVTNISALVALTGSATNAVVNGSSLSTTNSTNFSLFYDVLGQTNMRFLGLQQGSNVVLYRTGSNIVINATGGGSSGGTGTIISNANLLFVATNGNNSTAQRSRQDLPYRDPRAAFAAASAGDCVVVFPGIYTTNGIAKDGVNMFGYPGAIINFVGDGSGPARGIIDDRDSGPINMTIGGYFDFRYSTGLTGYNVGQQEITPQNTNSANLRGLITITNALSTLNLNCSSLSVTTLFSSGGPFALYVKNCKEIHVNCPSIIDPIYTNSFYIGDDDTASPVFAPSAMGGVYWEEGRCYVNSDTIQSSANAVYAKEPAASVGTNNLWVTAAHIENNGPQHCVYLVGRTADYKVWIDAKDIISVNSGGSGTVGFYQQGRFYIKAEKIASANIVIFSTVGTQVGWVTSHKISSTAKWCNVAGGTVFLECPNYEDLSGVSPGWDVSGGMLNVWGGYAQVLNGQGLRVSATGNARFKNVTIDTSAGNLMTNTPVFVGTNWVTLQSCLLLAPAAAPSIMAVGAQNVLMPNGTTGNKTNSPNITHLGGVFTVDSNVR